MYWIDLTNSGKGVLFQYYDRYMDEMGLQAAMVQSGSVLWGHGFDLFQRVLQPETFSWIDEDSETAGGSMSVFVASCEFVYIQIRRRQPYPSIHIQGSVSGAVPVSDYDIHILF